MQLPAAFSNSVDPQTAASAHLDDGLKLQQWFYNQYSPHTMHMHYTDYGKHALLMPDPPLCIKIFLCFEIDSQEKL